MKLRQAVEHYLRLKQSLGFRFATDSQILKAFSQTMGQDKVGQVEPTSGRAYLDGSGPVTRNQEVDRGRRKLLLDAMLGEGEKLIALPSLGPEASGAAGRAAARLAEVMAGPVKEVFGRRFKDHKFVVADVYDSATALFTLGDLEQGNLFVQGDPFGWHLQDGRPVVWVWRYDTSLSPSSESAHAKGGLLTTDTYLYAATRDNKNWICRPIADCDRASIRAEGFIEDMCVGRPLAISDRTMAGIKEQLKVLLAWAHKLPK